MVGEAERGRAWHSVGEEILDRRLTPAPRGLALDKYTIIDVDTHVTEPPDLWTSRVPASMKDRVPYVRKDSAGRDGWYLNDKKMALAGLTATAGVGDMQDIPSGYDDIHPASYDNKARLQYMDEMGIWAMVMYPNVAGFGNQEFLKLEDPDLMLSCVEAYNNWQTEWAEADSRRLLPITAHPVLGHRRRGQRGASLRRDGAPGHLVHR